MLEPRPCCATTSTPQPLGEADRTGGGEGKTLPEAPLMEAIAALVDGPAELTLLHFGHWGRLELRRRRQQSGQMGFGDLLLGWTAGPQAIARPP